jgi:HlyD family secretion protein
MNTVSAWIMGVLGAVFPSLNPAAVTAYNGYAEGDFVYVAPSAPGRIARIDAEEGASVAQGQLLFAIENTTQSAALRAAEAQVAMARANLDNLSTGSRGAEIEVIRASLAQAQADQRLALSTVQRSQQLLINGAVSQARFDSDTAVLQSADARVSQLEAQLHVAELPARDAQRIAAEAALDSALAQLDGARSALEDQTVRSPTAGRIDKVFYELGEVAGIGAPVVSILPPDDLKALFFVPEADRASVAIGQILAVTCDGCRPGITAKVTRLAMTPQYTPPIIYSRDERGRLVFRAEARLQDPGPLLPGQPLTLSPQP